MSNDTTAYEAEIDPEPFAYAACAELEDEYLEAAQKFPPFHSAHEGYAVLLEEVHELEYEVFHGTAERMREEAVQVGAMAMRFLIDVCGYTVERRPSPSASPETEERCGECGLAIVWDENIKGGAGRRHVDWPQDHVPTVPESRPSQGVEGERRRFWVMDERGETAVIRCGTPSNQYWWVICPQTTTLFFEPPETTDEVNCSNVCEFEDEHAWADAIIRADAAPPAAVPPPPETARLHDFRQVEEDLWACLRCGAEIVAGTTVADGEAIVGSTCPAARSFGHDDEIGALFEQYDRLVRWEEHNSRLDAQDPVIERAVARGRIVAFIANTATLQQDTHTSLADATPAAPPETPEPAEGGDVGREGTGEVLTSQESEAMTRVLGWYGSMRGTHVQFYKDVDDLRAAGRNAERDAARAEAEEMRAALFLAEAAMNNMGDALNEALITPADRERAVIEAAFEAVRAARQSPQEGK